MGERHRQERQRRYSDEDRDRDRDRGRDRSYRSRDSYSRRREEYHSRRDYDDYDSNSGRNERRSYDNRDRDYRGRSRDDYRDERRDRRSARQSDPSATIMIRGLDANCTEATVFDAMGEFARTVTKLRVVRDKDTGVGKGFAFADFATIENATAFLNQFPGSQNNPNYNDRQNRPSADRELFINDRPVNMEYASAFRQNQTQANDWICSMCKKSNFSRRSECFVCGHSFGPDCLVVGDVARTKEKLTGTDVKVLLVSGLIRGTTEMEVNNVFGEFGPIEAVRITPEGTRAYVEYFTKEQAQNVLSICMGQKDILRVGNALVTVEMVNLTPPSVPGPTNPMAYAALQAGQWANQNILQRPNEATGNAAESSMESNPQPPQQLLEWPTPFDEGGMSYRIQPSTGLYFEDKSGFYFDFKKKLYYSTVKNKYYKYEDKSFVECSPPESDNPESSEENPKKGKKAKKEKGLLSFSIGGDLSRELSADRMAQGTKVSSPTNGESKFDISVPAKGNGEKKGGVMPTPRRAKEISKNIQQWNTNQQKLSQVKNQPVCLLCRRKFKSFEKLKKHEEKSELHKENVRKRKLGIASKPISIAEPKSVAAATKAAEAAGYRDRAGDRRKMFGQDKKAFGSAGIPIRDDFDRIETPLHIADEGNRGASLLKAMGWKEGEGLGRNKDGITAPIGFDGSVQK